MELNDRSAPAATTDGRPYKLPVSVLVLVYTPALEVLLLGANGSAGFLAVRDGKSDRGRNTQANGTP